ISSRKASTASCANIQRRPIRRPASSPRLAYWATVLVWRPSILATSVSVSCPPETTGSPALALLTRSFDRPTLLASAEGRASPRPGRSPPRECLERQSVFRGLDSAEFLPSVLPQPRRSRHIAVDSVEGVFRN